MQVVKTTTQYTGQEEEKGLSCFNTDHKDVCSGKWKKSRKAVEKREQKPGQIKNGAEGK